MRLIESGGVMTWGDFWGESLFEEIARKGGIALPELAGVNR
jgi:hypothetical protein